MPSRFSGRCRAAASAASGAGHDPLGVLRTQFAGSPGTRRPAPVPGRDLDRRRDRDRGAPGNPAHPATGVAGSRAGCGERFPDGAEPATLWLPYPPAVHRRHRREDRHRVARPVRAPAHHSQHLRGGSRRGPRGAGSGAGMGMTDWQLLTQVELPLGFGVILAGVRVATVVSVGTATIAAAIGAGGLGVYIFRGVAVVDDTLILAGALPAALMALAADGLLGVAARRFAWRGR